MKQLDDAVSDLEAKVKGAVKDIRGFAKLSESAADDFAASAPKVVKTFTGDSGKLVAAEMAAAVAVSKASTAFDRDLVKYVEAAQADLDIRLRQAKEKEKKGGAAPVAGGKPVETKARLTLDSVAKVLNEDELMINIDDNKVAKMTIVEPMRDQLSEIEVALG